MNKNVVTCAVMGAVAVTALTGCRTGGDSGAIGETAPTQSAPVTRAAHAPDEGTSGGAAGGSAGGTVGRCHSSGLRARIGRLDQAAGLASSQVVVTNVGATTCRIQGFPKVSFADATASSMVGASERVGGPGLPVTLRPGASAWAGLDWVAPRRPSETAFRPAPALLMVNPPGENVMVKAVWPYGSPATPGTLRVRSFRPGTGPA